jgi:hypothetical protein
MRHRILRVVAIAQVQSTDRMNHPRVLLVRAPSSGAQLPPEGLVFRSSQLKRPAESVIV